MKKLLLTITLLVPVLFFAQDCVDDDIAAAQLANTWNPDITGCADAIPYLTEAGYPCDTDLSVLGMSGTITDICECTCSEFDTEGNPLLGNWYSDDIDGETEYVNINENTITVFGFNSDFNCFEEFSLEYTYIGDGIISVIDPDYGAIELSAIILENGDFQIISPEGDTLQFSSIEEIPIDLVMCSENTFECTDPSACNFNVDVIGGGCVFPGDDCLIPDPVIMPGIWGTLDESCECEPVYGCTNPNACNYDSLSTEDNGTCGLVDDCGDCQIPYCYDMVTNEASYVNELDCAGDFIIWVGNDCGTNPYCLSSEWNPYWNAGCIDLNEESFENKKMVRILDNLGREIKDVSSNQFIFIVFSNGSVEKKYIIDTK